MALIHERRRRVPGASIEEDNEILDEMAAEEARQYLPFLGRQDRDEHAEIYGELAAEEDGGRQSVEGR